MKRPIGKLLRNSWLLLDYSPTLGMMWKGPRNRCWGICWNVGEIGFEGEVDDKSFGH